MKNVLPIFDLYISSMYHLFHGVAHYAREHQWHLGLISSRFELPRHWAGDGILTHLNPSPPLVEFLRAHSDIPIVSFNPYLWGECAFPYVTVREDNDEIGRIAARYFLTLCGRHFCWYGQALTRDRYVAFADELARNGRETQAFILPEKLLEQPWDDIYEWLHGQLLMLPLPCAIFCENDSWARELLEAAIQSGFRIPEDIAILGVDNETLVCESVNPPLSSIDNRLGRVGYEGAALLDRLMNGEPPPDPPIRIVPVPQPVVRKSTDVLATDDDTLTRAIDFIRKNHTDDISVAQIARRVCISDSGLRKLMNRKIGISTQRLLLNMRLETACRLLRETELKIGSVAAQSGFGDVQSLYAIFRQELKTTPQQYRSDFPQNSTGGFL